MAKIIRFCPTCEITLESSDPSLSRDVWVQQECLSHIAGRVQTIEIKTGYGSLILKWQSTDGRQTYRDTFGNPISIPNQQQK